VALFLLLPPLFGTSSATSAPVGGGVAPPPSGAYWGLWRGPGPGRPSDGQLNYQAAEQQVGRTFAVARGFYKWGTMLPSSFDMWAASGGRIPMMSLRSKTSSGTIIPWADTAAGKHDQYLSALADSLRSWGKPAYFILDAEVERQVGTYGSAADFRSAWRHIVQVFRSRGVSNVAYTFTTETWSLNPQAGRLDLMNALYPGDDVVDWIAGDPYNFFKSGRWNSLSTEMDHWYQWATTSHPGKPLALAEWGSKEDPDDPNRKAAWLQQALGDLSTRYPVVKAVVYFDEEKHEDGTVNDWRIDTTALRCRRRRRRRLRRPRRPRPRRPRPRRPRPRRPRPRQRRPLRPRRWSRPRR
jgi:hypothetical protein